MNNIEEIKRIVYNKFSKYTFHEDSHTYTYIGEDGEEKTIGISSTQFIHSFAETFDEDKMSKIVAKKKGLELPTKEILSLWMDKSFIYDRKNFISKFGYDPVTPKFEDIKPALQKFYDIFKERLEIIGAEVVIASEDYDIAGSIDLLAYSKKLNAIVIIDNKSNKEIKREAYRDKKMLKPLDHLPDSNFWHYSLQGAIYKRILEKETGIKVSEKKFLIWFDSLTLDFHIIECANLDKEALQILEERKNDKRFK